ncbi:hypothetical protein [Marinivivus vitaminiproducens]|uniref:hypothetical protein n=1 Tax=Marinivivus vitaminiproducens TaxID=3035935 RepID=UPI0027A59428|nr:hypothetical protein P4R82_19380 [Geminicoccaceae bacterium SCSIO 64248]
MSSLPLIADALLAGASLASCLACAVLARRLRRLSQGDHGLGHALEALDQGVARLEAALAAASDAAAAADRLNRTIAAADAAHARLAARTEAASGDGDPLADVVPGSARRRTPHGASLQDALDMLTRLEASARATAASGADRAA